MKTLHDRIFVRTFGVNDLTAEKQSNNPFHPARIRDARNKQKYLLVIADMPLTHQQGLYNLPQGRSGMNGRNAQRLLMRAQKQIDHFHFFPLNRLQTLFIRCCGKKHPLADAALSGNGFKDRIAEIGKGIEFIKNEQIKAEGIAVELMRRTDNQICIRFLRKSLTYFDDLQIRKVLSQSGRNFHYDLSA